MGSEGSPRRFEAVYQHAVDGIVLHADGRIVEANPAACRMLRRERSALIGARLADVITLAHRPPAPASPPAAPARDVIREGEILLPDGTVRRAECGLVQNVEPGVHLAIFRDVEDRTRAEDAQRFLELASQVFATSLDYDETLAAVMRLAVPRIADWAGVDLLDEGGAFRRVAVAHVDPAKVALADELRKRQVPRLEDPTGLGAVVRTGHPELVELVTDEMLVAALASDPELLAIFRGLGLVSAMTVPLRARGRAIGAISLVSAESRRRYGAADLAFAEELARRAGYAVDNAMFVRELRAANAVKDLVLRRAEHLQATATELVRAGTVEEIARVFKASDRAAPLEAVGCALLTHTPAGLAVIAVTSKLRGVAEQLGPVSLDGDHPLSAAVRERAPVWIPDMASCVARFPALSPAPVLPELEARAVVPLFGGDACIGALGVAFAHARAFDDDEKRYLVAVANLWGQALHRARLAAAEHDALRRAAEAETIATRKKDEFLAMLGHELRNPLAPIMMATALLRSKGGPPARELDVIERQARHLARLVDDLLDVSRITSGKLSLRRTAVQLRGVVSEAVERAEPMFASMGVVLRVDVSPEAMVVDGDPDRLVQVITNLLVNSAKFTARGRRVFVGARREGASGVIEVRDEGEGIEAALLPHVFDLFAQGAQGADRRSGGLGLGLAIARSIVSAHGGHIGVASPGPGLGTTVRVELALAAEEGAGRAPDAASVARGAGQRVLVVDDNADSAEILAAWLGDIGYRSSVATYADQALAALRSAAADAVILDIGLPDLDGYALARAIAGEHGPSAPKLIALTGYAQASDRQRALAAGFVEHLSKPVDMVQLATVLRDVLA